MSNVFQPGASPAAGLHVLLARRHRSHGWVQQLAARLVRDGVDVTLDQWDLKAGLNLNLLWSRAHGIRSCAGGLVVELRHQGERPHWWCRIEGNILSADMFNGGLHKDRIIPVIRTIRAELCRRSSPGRVRRHARR
ncbi:TIR domain-containing protein [Rhodococcus hoagii]|nr:TIR domain-containing protein [Prescottella equi]